MHAEGETASGGPGSTDPAPPATWMPPMGASAKTWHNISECLSVLRFLAVLAYCTFPVIVFFSSSAGLERCLVSDVLLSPTFPPSPCHLLFLLFAMSVSNKNNIDYCVTQFHYLGNRIK